LAIAIYHLKFSVLC